MYFCFDLFLPHVAPQRSVWGAGSKAIIKVTVTCLGFLAMHQAVLRELHLDDGILSSQPPCQVDTIAMVTLQMKGLR